MTRHTVLIASYLVPEHGERISDLFCDNLRRYLDGLPLRNHLNTTLGF